MKKIYVSLLLALSVFAFPLAASAAPYNPIGKACTGSAKDSSVCNADGKDPLSGSTGIISKVAQLVVYATGIISVFMIIIAGFTYVMSAGDPQKTSAAKNTILYAVIGLVVALSAQLIIKFVLQNIG